MKRFMIALLSCGVCGCDSVTLPLSPSITVNGTEPIDARSGDGTLKIYDVAHYAPWHRKNATQDTIAQDGHTHPVRGSYDSADPNIIRADNAELYENGVSPMISWWGPEGSKYSDVGDGFLDLYLSIPSPVQCILLYEVTGRLTAGADGTYNFDDPANAATFSNDIQHLMSRYLTRPEYRNRFLLINGKPVVFIWLSHAFTGRFDSVSRSIPGREKITIIGSNFTISGATPAEGDLSVIGGLDAVSAYGIYDPNLARQRSTDGIVGHEDEVYRETYRMGVGRWSLWLSRNAPQIPLILPLEFSYHDNRGNFPLTSTQGEADAFIAMVQEMIVNSVVCGRNIQPYIIHVSWNEWYEGSTIQPSVEYGTGFMDSIRRAFKDPVSTASVRCP